MALGFRKRSNTSARGAGGGRSDTSARVAGGGTARGRDPDTMIPARSRRRGAESILVRLVATTGIVGIGVALGAILVSSNVQGWIVGLVVALVSVALAALLWSSRRV